MNIDLNSSYQKAQEKIKSSKTFREISDAAKSLEKGNQKIPFDQFDTNLLSPLEKLKEQQKRFQRQSQSQLQNLLSLAKENSGSGKGFIGFVKNSFLEAFTRCEPKIQQILQDEMFGAIGCDQEQKYNTNQDIFIPVQSIDLFKKLTTDPSSAVGKLIYEKNPPKYNEFPFSMNRELYARTQEPDQTFSVFFGNPYKGTSEQNLFDISYVKQNGRGVTGDFFKVKLSSRKSLGNVGEFLGDYMSTIKTFDSNNLMAELVNLLTNSVDIKAGVGTGEVASKTRFNLIMQRVLGLCFDSRKEIDVSGVAKVAELDGVDDSFFEMTDVDNAFIQNTLSNYTLRSLEFVECNNLRVNVDYNNLVDQMVEATETQDLNNPTVLKTAIEKIVDSISDNPEWKLQIPNDFNVKLKIDEDLLQKLPLALVASVLSPKILLPIFIMIIAIGNEYADEVQSLQQFMIRFKKFFINFVSKVGAIFIEELFEIIKRDLLLLVQSILSDITRSKLLKQYAMIASILEVAIAVAALIDDYRKCKSVIDNILLILGLISKNLNLGPKIPGPLLSLAPLLGGTSPENTTINIIEQLQKLGIPTGPLPSGQPNFGLISELARQKGQEFAEAATGYVQVSMLSNPVLPSGKASQPVLSGKKF